MEVGGQNGILVLIRTELGFWEAENGIKRSRVSMPLRISSKHFDSFRTACLGQVSLREEYEGSRKLLF